MFCKCGHHFNLHSSLGCAVDNCKCSGFDLRNCECVDGIHYRRNHGLTCYLGCNYCTCVIEHD